MTKPIEAEEFARLKEALATAVEKLDNGSRLIIEGALQLRATQSRIRDIIDAANPAFRPTPLPPERKQGA